MDGTASARAPSDPQLKKRHTKSRTGCGTCKRRKIKCDEQKPACANCAKRGVECDFQPSTIPTPPTIDASLASRLVQPSTPDGIRQTVTQGEEWTPKDTSNSASTATATEPISSIESIHLELLHNYITLTSHTLASDPVLKNVWRVNVPQVGFSNEFVMRSIFALSALHMSLFSADKSDFYLTIARSEHGAALREIASVLSHVTAENCSAVYIAAALTFFYAWASPRQKGDFFLIGASGTAEWVFLLQGVRGISESWKKELRSGPFSPMFRLGNSRVEDLGTHYLTSPTWLSTVEHAQLTYLKNTMAHAAPDTQTADVYRISIENLEKSFCAILCSSLNVSRNRENSTVAPPSVISGGLFPLASTSDVYSWLYKMEDDFIKLLSQREPLALVIFAHFCILLKFLGSCWWMQGWSTHLLQEIWDHLDEEHRLWIRWPIEEIGWRPKA